MSWEVQITTVNSNATPPTVGNRTAQYIAKPEQCAEAERLLQAGRAVRATVTDRDPITGNITRPPIVERVFDALANQ